jgi:hypothetical protein
MDKYRKKKNTIRIFAVRYELIKSFFIKYAS